MNKTFNIVFVEGSGDVAFNVGQILGSRHKKDEAVIYVVSNEDHVLDALKPYVNAPIEGHDIAVHVGVTDVEKSIEFYHDADKRVHLVYYMPAHIKALEPRVQDHELLMLPIAITSTTIRRQIIAIDAVSAVTLFVTKETENV